MANGNDTAFQTSTRNGYLTIKRATLGAGALLLALLVLMAYLNFQTVSEVKIGGAAYSKIANGKDFVADVLPPPLFPVEAFALAHVIDGDPTALAGLKPRIETLQTQYSQRLAFWREEVPKSNLMDQNDWQADQAKFTELGEAFWAELTGVFLPAAERRDEAAMDLSVGKLTTMNADFTVLVDAIAAKAAAQIKQAEEASIADANSAFQRSTYYFAGICVLVCLMIFAINSFVVKALTRMTGAMTMLASGNLDTEIPMEHRNDEVGNMAYALKVFKQQAIENTGNKNTAESVIAVLGDSLANLARGNLTHRIANTFEGDLDRLRVHFNSAADSLSETIAGVKRGTEGIKSGSEEIAQASDDLSRRTETQAANLEQTAAAVAEITATVKKTATGANQARNVVVAAKNEADKSGEVVRKAVDAMQGIERSSQKITQIIGVIDEIAFQTNLLALNAGVEAARAGDAGRGFAVVASEVRALAQRSADAAKEIKDLLSTSRTQVEQGVQLVADTGSSLKNIIERVAEINAVVSEIAASTEQQSSGLQEVNAAVDQMDQVTQQNAAMVEEATAATKTLTQQSLELARMVARFTTAAVLVAEQSAKRSPDREAYANAKPAKKKVAVAEARNDDWEEF